MRESSTLSCPTREPPATCSHLKIRSLKRNKIQMKSATLGAFQVLGGDGRPVALILDSTVTYGAGLAEPRGSGSRHVREAVGLLSSALDMLSVRGEANSLAMPNRQVGTWVRCSERGVSRQHGAGSPQCTESGRSTWHGKDHLREEGRGGTWGRGEDDI